MSIHQEPEPKNQAHSTPKPVDGAFAQQPAIDAFGETTDTQPETSELQHQRTKGDRFDNNHNFSHVEVYAQNPAQSQPQLFAKPLDGIVQREDQNEELEIQAKPLDNIIQRQDEAEEEEEVQTKPLTGVIQREAETEEELEAVQTKPLTGVIQREAETEEELEAVQTKPLTGVIQREAEVEEELEAVQTKPLTGVIQREAETEEELEAVQTKPLTGVIQREAEAEEESEEIQTKPLTGVIQREAETEEKPEAVQTKQIQAKVVVGAPGDKYEQEADRVADEVMSMDVTSAPQAIQQQIEEDEQPIQKSPIAASITPLIQRQTESDKPIQTKPAVQRTGDGGVEASSSLSDRLSSQKGSGSAINEEVRSFMEPRFGNDFSSVRIHTGSEAVQMNKELKAQAFAHGSDIYFNQGKYNPQSDEGKRLLAHELTHVVQQTGAKKLQTKPLISLKSNKETLQAKITPVSDAAIQLKEAPKSAQSDPAFQAVVNKTKGIAKEQKSHPPAKTKSTEAQAAAKSPPNEVESKAQDKQVQEMNQQQPGKFNAGAFKAALMQKIAAVTPNTLEEADKFKQSNKIDSVKGEMTSSVTNEKKQAANPIETKTKQPPNTSGITPKPVTPLPPTQAGAKPSGVDAAGAVPKPKDASEVSLEASSKSLDEQMTSANITDEQLTKSNEPEFKSAVESKKTAQADAATAPQAYRQQEQATLTQAQGEAKTTAQTQLEGMHGGKAQLLAQVVGQQGETKGKDEQKRSEVANHIQGIYNTTKQKVEASLSQLDVEVNKEFDAGAAAAKTQFENYVEGRMQRYKDERYDGLLGAGKWVKDKFFGMPSEVNAFYQEGKKQYLASMDKAMDKVANLVSTKLNAAKAEISNGRQEIQKYVAGLDPSLRQVGQEAAQNIQGKFDELEQSVDNKEGELLDSLAQKYNENLQQIDARIDEMKAANRGFVDKAKDAIAGTIKTILELKNMLMGVLAKAAGAIDKIIKDPIGFLGNLISGIKQGFQNFASNIGEHLKKGMLAFLTGALAGAGITMPESFDLKGIFSLVMQVLGVVYEGIKSRVIKALGKNGEKIFNALEKSFEMFVILKNEGIAGLWQFIQDKIGDLKVMVIDTIQSFVVESVIKAGVMWVLSLLNPASAFVRACKAIYDIIMFFIERGSQIAELVSAVTDSVAAIASGAVGGAAKLIENALGTALPVVISFMASLLGLGGISEKIGGIIKTVRAPIDKAIDWLIAQAVKAAKKIGKAIGFGKDKDKKDKDKEKAEEEGKSVEIPFPMNGEQHTLFLIPGPTPSLEMASKRDRLSNKIGKAVAGLMKQEPKPVNQINDLKELGGKAKTVQNLLNQRERTRDETIKMKSEGKAIATALSEYARKYAVSDIQEILDMYPPPKVGSHGTLIGEGPLHDGTTRESHHAPPVELAVSMANQLRAVAGKARSLDPEAEKFLLDAVEKLVAAEKGHGKTLPAILLHHVTHKNAGEGGYAIHSKAIRAPLEAWLSAKGADTEKMVTMKDGTLASNPTGEEFDSFFGKQRHSKKYKDAELKRIDKKELVAETWRLVDEAYDTVAAQTLAAVEIALSTSKVDGKEADKKAAIHKLRSSQQQAPWRNLIRSLFPSV